MKQIKIKKQPPTEFWNLKIGGVYETETKIANRLIEHGCAVPLVERSTIPVPGEKPIVGNSNNADRPPRRVGRNKKSRPRDE